MENEGSLPSSQQTAIGPYFKVVEYSPHLTSHLRFILILYSHLWLLPSDTSFQVLG